MKIGIAGAGFMGTAHAQAWLEAGAELVGIVAETIEEARPLANEYGVSVFPDLMTMIGEIEVLDICTPTHLHYEMVLLAAEAGLDIVCEKPLARTVDQAVELVHKCHQAGVQLLVAHVVRYFPEYVLAKAAVDRGQIGKPGVVRLSRGSYRPKKPLGNWFLDEEKSGGILMDLMIHDFDYARWIAGEVESVFAKKVSTGHPNAPIDYGLALLKHHSGTISHIAGAWAYPPPTFRTSIEISGDAGVIEFDSDATAPIRSLLIKDSQGDSPDVALPSNPVSESPYTTQIKEFYSVLSGDAESRVIAKDGLAAVQIAHAAYQSAQTGEVVNLDNLVEVKS